ncbi:hypothetical protein [Geoalkalibacter halelectricus]|uniref:hypothetical protein n=1 Tax=Geoalkalibacter halelectricus TaxID=2847045 RepID=UPI00266F9339|nr:hypothetical protein [Geoalkalibacter halelectricus]MDO3377389.1 hypothetical protein [Geoalkalibacter halelectricus]
MKLQILAQTLLILLLATVSTAFAVDTTKVYNSGILVLVFLGFCALVVVIQILPAIVLMFGSIRSMIKSASQKNLARQKVK